jgi:hypothetical protein
LEDISYNKEPSQQGQDLRSKFKQKLSVMILTWRLDIVAPNLCVQKSSNTKKRECR